MLPGVMEPPCGSENRVIRLRTVDRAMTPDISATILAGNLKLVSLGWDYSSREYADVSLRQHYLDQVHRVGNASVALSAEWPQLPAD